jgi:hypothetical protein
MDIKNHFREFSDTETGASQAKDSKTLTARRKLLEIGLQKDKNLKRKNRLLTLSTERLSNLPCRLGSAFSIGPIIQSSTLKNISEKTTNEVSRKFSKSPTATRRNKSIDLTKNSASAVQIPKKNPEKTEVKPYSSRKKIEKPTDCILKIAEKFSVKKINVKLIQELKKCSSKGDEIIGRALIALLSDVDYHIKESQNFPIEIFFEYINSPGIVVQSIKRIPDHIINERITLRKNYLENILKALEIYNEATTVTNNPGFNLLVELLEAIFNFKQLACKNIRFASYEQPKAVPCHNRTHMSLDIAPGPPAPIKKRGKSISDSNFFVPAPCPIEKTPQRYSPEKPRPHPITNKNIEASALEPKEQSSFILSKNVLLEKFFSRMGTAKPDVPEKDKSPAKEFLNKSLEYLGDNEKTNYIKVKKSNRPSSATPRSNSAKKNTEKSILKEYKSNKNLEKPKTEDTKQKNILLGSRFYKKIDDKFIQYLLEKLKKDPKDIKKLKKSNFEEYSKKKNHYVHMNKKKWVNDTLRHLETSDILISINENDLNQEAKHEAMLEHLSQSKHLASLIRKAEQIEHSSRKNY